MFAGNTADVTTLATMLDRLAARAGQLTGLAAGATVVMDRGLASAQNIALLERRALHYIIASRQSERNRWLATFTDEVGFTAVIRKPSPTNPHQRKSRVDVRFVRGENCHHVLCRSEQRVAKDRAIREKHEQRLLADLERLAKRIADRKQTTAQAIDETIGRLKERHPRVARYDAITWDAKAECLSYPSDDAEYQAARHLDGTYLLKTDRTDLTADEAWLIYSLLSRAEDAFRDMKAPLGERRFHHLEHRVEAHIFLCLLAFHLLVASWASVPNTLETHQVPTVVLPTMTGRCLRVRTAATPDPEVHELYDLLCVPSTAINPSRRWSRERVSWRIFQLSR